MLELIHASYRIGEKTLVDNISLQIKAGEVLAILGENGAGKSTLLKLISGELNPTSGEVELDGKSLNETRFGELAKRRAVLAQSNSLSFPFKVRQVVAMGRSPHRGEGIIKEAALVEEAMLLTDIKHLQQRSFTTLSGGERQRVHLARVLVQIWNHSDDNLARYLLLDEPTSALDLAHQHKALLTAKEFAKQNNVGVLVILHDLNLASIYADRIAILHQGKLQCQGPPQQVLKPDNIYKAFCVEAMVIDHPVCHGRPLVVTPAKPKTGENG